MYFLVTSVQGSLMAADPTTREGAMDAAVEWVESEARTRLTGSLSERYGLARRRMVGLGGQMEIIGSSIFGDG